MYFLQWKDFKTNKIKPEDEFWCKLFLRGPWVVTVFILTMEGVFFKLTPYNQWQKAN